MPDSTKNVVIAIDDYVNDISDKLAPLQKKVFAKISAELKELSLDAEGNIKRTSSNLEIINSVKYELNAILQNPLYQVISNELSDAMIEVNDLQDNYYNSISDVKIPPVVDAIQDQSFEAAKSDLTKAGFQENVVNAASDIVQTAITEGSSYSDMNDKLKDFIVGDKETPGKLVSYTKQILGDTMHTASRNYNSIMTNKLGLKWYRYVGALVETSRPFCIAMEHKEWIHESELGKCARGDIDGKKVSLAGLMPDTNAENLVSRCGGYNCGHHLIPVSVDMVPSKIRRKFEDVDTKDRNELADERPRH